MSYRSGSAGCYFFILIVGIIVSGIYALGSWIYSAATGHRAEHAAAMQEARDGIVTATSGMRTLHAHGILTRTRLEKVQWVYAGENETTATFLSGPLGEGRVDCKKDVRDMAEGGGFYRREFSALYSGGAGKTLITRQGSASAGPEKEVGIDVLLGKTRPPLMDYCDDAAGWSFSVYGRWPGRGDSGEEFADILDGKHAGVSAESATLNDLPMIRIRKTSGDSVNVYWLDINNGYQFKRWERRVGAGKSEHEVEGWEVKNYLLTPSGFYYPNIVEGERMDAGGAVVEKFRVDVDSIDVNDKASEGGMYQLNVPAGTVTVREEGKPDVTLTGTAEENSRAVNGGWGGAGTQESAATSASTQGAK